MMGIYNEIMMRTYIIVSYISSPSARLFTQVPAATCIGASLPERDMSPSVFIKRKIISSIV